MAVSNHYLNQTLHHLSQVVPVSYRRIFAGAGIYHQGVLFAVVVDNILYFRVDENSVHPYQEREMPSLCPDSALSPESHFYQLPDDVLRHAQELLFWMRAAVEASLASNASAVHTDAADAPSLPLGLQKRTIAG